MSCRGAASVHHAYRITGENASGCGVPTGLGSRSGLRSPRWGVSPTSKPEETLHYFGGFLLKSTTASANVNAAPTAAPSTT